MVNDRCVVIGGGTISDYKKTASNIDNHDYIICADKGYVHCRAMNFKPDLIVGDFDSSSFPADAGCKVIKLNPEKDETDLFIAVSEGYKLGFREFLLVGCLGGRFDHTYANLTLLSYWLDNNAELILADEQNRILMLNPGTYKFDKIGKYISFFAYSGTVNNLTLKGVKYPLENFNLNSSCGLCVSNEITSDKCSVAFDDGKLLTVFSWD